MKKAISIAVCITLIMSLLAACSSAQAPSGAPSAERSASEATPSANGDDGFPLATTEDVQNALSDGSAVVVDTRVNDAYNGWALDGVARGGHIPGATDFPAAGLASGAEDAEIIINRSLEHKGLTGEARVILYDAGGGEALQVAEFLAGKGISHISLYDVNAWADDENKEMESYPQYELIVPAAVVKDLLDGKEVATFDPDKPVKIVEVSWGDTEQSGYLEGHVPTAFHINTDDFEPPTETDPPEWRLGSDEILQNLVLKNGITANDCVITTSAQPMAAYRFATILQYLGVQDVRVMNGGMNNWNAAGFALSTEEVIPEPVDDFGAEIPANPDVIDTVAETQAFLADDDRYHLMDIRTWGEYIGNDTGYSYHNIAGRIDGAVFAYAGEDGDSNSMTYYRNADWSMRNGYEILSLWEEAGANLEHRLSFMCGGGWRAAETYWFARVMGLDAALYSDGWCAWSNDGLPFLTGEPGSASASDASDASAA